MEYVQAEDGIRDGISGLEFRRVLFRSPEKDIELGLPYIDRNGELLSEDIATQIAWYQAHGMIEGKLDPAKVANTNFLKKAMQ